MNLHTLAQGEPWMTPDERSLNHEFIHATTELLATRGVPENPLIMLRLNDVIATWLLARRLESALAPESGAPAVCPTPAQAGAIGKCRDRLRRAMKELEACFARDSAPGGDSLVARLHQVAQRHSEPAPREETPDPTGTQPAGSIDNENPNKSEPQTVQNPNPDPSVNAPADTTAVQPETSAIGYTPTPPHIPSPEPPPPLNRATRRRQAKEKRRKNRK